MCYKTTERISIRDKILQFFHFAFFSLSLFPRNCVNAIRSDHKVYMDVIKSAGRGGVGSIPIQIWVGGDKNFHFSAPVSQQF